jgi:amino acid transporter
LAAPLISADPSAVPSIMRTRRKVKLLGIVTVIFFCVSGGAYGLEPLWSSSGPGMAMLLLFVTPVIYSVPVALFTAELSTAIPVEGGFYQWVKRAWGNFAGFQEGMINWVDSWVDMALYPVLFSSYLGQIWSRANPGADVFYQFKVPHIGLFQVDMYWVLGIVCVVVAITALNILGAKAVGDTSTLFTIAVLIPFALLAAWGIPKLFAHHIDPVVPFTPAHTSVIAAFGAGLVVVMWNYNGFDSISTVTEELDNPRKTLPKALAYSLILIVACYVLPGLGAMAGLHSAGGWANWQAGSFSAIGGAVAGKWLMYALAIGGMLSAAGLYSSLLLSNSRIPFIMSVDGWIPRWFVRVSPRFGTPVVSIVACSVIYALLSNNSFLNLLNIDVLLTNVTIALELSALIKLRYSEPNLERPYKIPGGWPVIVLMSVPLIGVICYAAWNTIVDSDDTNDRWVLLGAFAFCLLSYFPANWLRKRYEAEGVAGHPEEVAQ